MKRGRTECDNCLRLQRLVEDADDSYEGFETLKREFKEGGFCKSLHITEPTLIWEIAPERVDFLLSHSLLTSFIWIERQILAIWRYWKWGKEQVLEQLLELYKQKSKSEPLPIRRLIWVLLEADCASNDDVCRKVVATFFPRPMSQRLKLKLKMQPEMPFIHPLTNPYLICQGLLSPPRDWVWNVKKQWPWFPEEVHGQIYSFLLCWSRAARPLKDLRSKILNFWLAAHYSPKFIGHKTLC